MKNYLYKEIILVLVLLAAIVFGIEIGYSRNVKQIPNPKENTASSSLDIKSTDHPASYTETQWKVKLTPDQFSVLRKQGTETPFTSDLLHETRKGTFVTADCGEAVFRSETKFDSGTGWPSFYAPIKQNAVVIKNDNSLGISRDEVETPICHSHLGHLFHDAPQTPTGDRYCINGVALKFIPDEVQ